MNHSDLLRDAAGALEVAGVDTARLDAEVLLAHAAGVGRSGLFARLRDEADTRVRQLFEECVRRRVAREPLAYITGEREFYSLAFRVNADVLIPRPETELLVDAVLRRAPANGRVLDVGTGSGCIAIAIAVNRTDLVLDACDVSPSALALAGENARMHGVGGRVRLVESDLFTGLAAADRYDVIVSNPPYVAEGAAVEPELAWEPRGALYAGAAGMDVIEHLLSRSVARLSPAGSTIVELGSDQERAVRGSAKGAGYGDIEILRDLAGHPRVLIARTSDSPAS